MEDLSLPAVAEDAGDAYTSRLKEPFSECGVEAGGASRDARSVSLLKYAPSRVAIPSALRLLWGRMSPFLHPSVAALVAPSPMDSGREAALGNFTSISRDGGVDIAVVSTSGYQQWHVGNGMALATVVDVCAVNVEGVTLFHIVCDVESDGSSPRAPWDRTVAFVTSAAPSTVRLRRPDGPLTDLDVPAAVTALHSSSRRILVCTGSTLYGFTNTTAPAAVFSIPMTSPPSSPSTLPSLQGPQSTALGLFWLAHTAAHPSSPSSPVFLPLSHALTGVMSAVTMASQWLGGGPPPPLSHTAVVVRDIVSGGIVCEFCPHGDVGVSVVTFDPSGMLLATASADGQWVAVFYLAPPSSAGKAGRASPRLLCTYHRGVSPGVILSLQFSQASDCVVAITSNGTAHVFRVDATPVFGELRATVIPPLPADDATGVVGPAVPAHSRGAHASVYTTVSQWRGGGDLQDRAPPTVPVRFKLKHGLVRELVGLEPGAPSPCNVSVTLIGSHALLMHEGVLAITCIVDGLSGSSLSTSVQLAEAWDFRRRPSWVYPPCIKCRTVSECSSVTRASSAQASPTLPSTEVPAAVRGFWISKAEPVTHAHPVVPFWCSPLVRLHVRDAVPPVTTLPLSGKAGADRDLAARRAARLLGVRRAGGEVSLAKPAHAAEIGSAASRPLTSSGELPVPTELPLPPDAVLGRYVHRDPYFPMPTAPPDDGDGDFEFVDAPDAAVLPFLSPLEPALPPMLPAAHVAQSLTERSEPERDLFFTAEPAVAGLKDAAPAMPSVWQHGVVFGAAAEASFVPQGDWLGGAGTHSPSSIAAKAYVDSQVPASADVYLAQALSSFTMSAPVNGWGDTDLFGEADAFRTDTPSVTLGGHSSASDGDGEQGPPWA